MKLDRLLAIVILLLERDLVRGKDLAERFSVTLRTIQRDMEALNRAGIPVYTQPGAQGGYGLVPGYRLSARLAEGDDFLNLLTALKGIQGSFADKRFLGVLEKVHSLLPRNLRSAAAEREGTLVFDYSLPWNDSALAATLRTLDAAIARRTLVSFSYTSHREQAIPRVVEPMTLILQWGAWYLYGYCRLRSDYRLFRAERIRALECGTERFERRDKSYRAFLAERPSFKNDRLVELVFVAQAEARAVVEEHHPSRELEYREDGSILVRCVQPEEERLYRYLLSYGPSVEVLEPPRLRGLLRDRAAAVIKMYG